jgi:hypothetical protein
MKRTLIRTALAAGAFAVCLPVFAQQAPVSPNAPNPSAPPVEGQKPDRGGLPPASEKMKPGGQTSQDQMTGGQTSGMERSQSTHHSKSTMNKRSSKPRQKDAAPAPSAEAPSGPKGDSPNPTDKQ